MPLANLLYPSPERTGFEEFLFQNHQHHLALNKAILETYNVLIPDFELWPVQDNNIQSWLLQHQEAHNAIAQVTGVQTPDLTGLDFKNKSQTDYWYFVHFTTHQASAQFLKFSFL